MKASVLERLFSADRHRRKMGDQVGDFVPPVATSFPSEPDQAPWLTSLSTGKFGLTQAKDGFVGQSFSECPLTHEGGVLLEMYSTMRTLQRLFQWRNLCGTLAEAQARMKSFGLEPKTLIVPFSMLSEVAGSNLTEEEAEMLLLTKGCVAEVEGVKIISAGSALPKGTAILGTTPSLTGVYTRIYDHLAITVLQADRTLVLVGDAVA